MQQNRRTLFKQALGFSLLTLGPAEIAWGAKLVDVRMWPAQEYTRVTIEHDSPLDFKHFMVRSANPIRLVVDIKNLRLTPQLKRMIENVKPNDPYIQSVRIGQFLPDTVRLVMDLKEDVNPQVFLLKPYANFKYRLVFDLYPAKPVDVVGQVIAEEAAKLKAQAQAVKEDPLGLILANLEDEAKRAQTLRETQLGLTQAATRVTQGVVNQTISQAQLKTHDLIGELAQKLPSPPTPVTLPPPTVVRVPAKTTPSEPATSSPLLPPQEEKTPSVARDRRPARVKKRETERNETLVIVVDPGHGGEDPGAIGKRKRTYEKTVVLQIGKRLAKLINETPGMRAVLTRNNDYFVSLGGRVAIARKVKAHILVSIHADAWIKPNVKGSSVFMLSEKGASSAAAKWLAKSQNESDLIGGVNSNAYDPAAQTIVADLTKTWTTDYSYSLASHVLSELDRVADLHRGEVERANFAVLKGQGIPSILVETGFISNPEEEMLLRSPAHQERIAKAILTGIRKQIQEDNSLATTLL